MSKINASKADLAWAVDRLYTIAESHGEFHVDGLDRLYFVDDNGDLMTLDDAETWAIRAATDFCDETGRHI